MGKRSVKYHLKNDHILNQPDEITRVFDLDKENIKAELPRWVGGFRAKMERKHWPNDFDIKIHTESMDEVNKIATVKLICTVGETDGEVVDV